MFKKLLCGMLLLGMIAATAISAFAAEFAVKRLGDLEVIALQDIPSEGKPELLIGLSKADADKYLVPGALKNSINAYVVKHAGKTLLFDAGLGTGGARKGQLPEALAQAGLKPEDIDVVLITHFHGDHVGGLTDGGKPVFTRARLLVPKVELDAKAGKGIEFYQAYGDKAGTFVFEEEIFPGLVALDASGHTPGHAAFRIEAGVGRLLIAGDVIHFANVQLPLPDVAVTYDSDPAKAVKARKKIFDMAAKENLPIAAVHMPFPGMGWVSKDGKGYSFKELDK